MARVTKLIDDTDGSEATQTVTFGAFGKTYEIDLNDPNASAFLATLTHYATKGREVTRETPKSSKSTRTAGKSSGPAGSTSELREWARQNGWPELGDRGRVSGDIVKAFNERPQGPVTVVGEDDISDVVAEIKAPVISTNTKDTNSATKLPKVTPLPKQPREKIKPSTTPFNPADSALVHG